MQTLHGDGDGRCRDFPANIIVTTGANRSKISQFFQNADILTHINPFTNDYNQLYIATTNTGVENIKEYLLNGLLAGKSYNYNSNDNHIVERVDQLKDRFISFGNGNIEDGIDNMLINVSNHYNTDHNGVEEERINFEHLLKLLYSKYNIKYISLESGKKIIEKLIEENCLSQLDLTLMHESIVDRKQLSKQQVADKESKQQFQLFDLKDKDWKVVKHTRYLTSLATGNTDKNCSLTFFTKTHC